MKEFITIKNFGPLSNIDNLEIKQFTLLIGESASGKSTLMKVVSMMRYLYKMANIRSYLYWSKITRSPFRIRLDSMLKRQGMSKMLTKDSVIVYCAEMDSGAEYEIRIEEKKLRKTGIIAQTDIMFNKVSFISENRNIIPTWAQTSWKNKGATLGFYFHETNDDFGNASIGEKEILLEYVGMRMTITHPKGKPIRYQIIPDDNRHSAIELPEASSGIQTSAPLALIVDYFARDFSFKDAFNRSVMSYLYEMENLSKFKAVSEPAILPKRMDVHIEEPELSLFPDAQCRLIEKLIYTAQHAQSDRTINLMMATHSPYILNYMNVLLRQTAEERARVEAEKMAVYRIYEGSTQSLMATDDDGKALVDAYDLTEMMSAIYNEFNELSR